MRQRKARANRVVAPQRVENGDVDRADTYLPQQLNTTFFFIIVSFFVLIFCRDMKDRHGRKSGR